MKYSAHVDDSSGSSDILKMESSALAKGQCNRMTDKQHNKMAEGQQFADTEQQQRLKPAVHECEGAGERRGPAHHTPAHSIVRYN